MKVSKIVLLTGPSGVGKATIEKELFKDESLNLAFSISATTRSPREGEKHGEQYYFISHEEFDKKIKSNDFVEWNKHFSNKYGTLKSEIKRIQDNNKVPFLEVETEGAKNILKNFDSNQVLSIFISPPSLKELKVRIANRGSETKEQIEQRLNRVKQEMQDNVHFDYIVVNDKLKSSVKRVKEILKKELGI